jgi:hypothetical protein
MFTPLALALLSSPLLASAIILPSEPTPDTVFTEGSKCHIAWSADANAASAWKTTNIQLMTGDNYKMVHLSTVATVDGSADGVFDYDCPDVTINSNIYFYQFTSPDAPIVDGKNVSWTGRFTIAGKDGEVTEPTEINTPSTTDNVKWGTGALVDPSSAKPAPSYLGGQPDSSSPPGGLPASDSGSGSASASAPASNTSGFSRTSNSASAGPTGSPSGSKVNLSPSASNSGAGSEPSGAAVMGAAIDSRILQTLSALVISAVGFTFVL